MLELQNLTPAQLAVAADANLVAHMSWAQQRTPGMYVDAQPDLVVVDSGLPCDTFNVICRARLAAERASERIHAAVDHFTRSGRPFSWWVGPADQPTELGELLSDAGLEPLEVSTAMAADLDPLQASSLAQGDLRIRRARSASELHDFARVVAANWTPPDPQVLRFYEQATPALLAGDAPLWLYVGYLDGQPVAASELTTGGGVVGLYSVCTLEVFRRRGFGAAMTLQPLLDAQDQGFRTAILQASPEGARVYARIGFRQFGEVTEYKTAHIPGA